MLATPIQPQRNAVGSEAVQARVSWHALLVVHGRRSHNVVLGLVPALEGEMTLPPRFASA